MQTNRFHLHDHKSAKLGETEEGVPILAFKYLQEGHSSSIWQTREALPIHSMVEIIDLLGGQA